MGDAILCVCVAIDGLIVLLGVPATAQHSTVPAVILVQAIWLKHTRKLKCFEHVCFLGNHKFPKACYLQETLTILQLFAIPSSQKLCTPSIKLFPVVESSQTP